MDPVKNLATLKRAQRDPGWWITTCLGSPLWSKQVEIAESVRDNPRTAVRSCHGAGKSYVAARIALWFLYCFPGSIVVTTAPTYRQVAKILWQELRVAFHASRVPLEGKILDTELKIEDKWFAFGFTADHPDNFQGIHAPYVLVILDEAAGMSHDIWIAADGLLTGDNCRLLSIGNPTDPTGDFFKEFKSPGVNKIKISAHDTPNFTNELGYIVQGLVTPAWVADKAKRWGVTSPMYESRVDADFPKLGDKMLFPLALIEQAVRYEAELRRTPNVLGCDIARFGVDETVLAHTLGARTRIHQTSSKEGLMETAGRIKLAASQLEVEAICIDDTGLGGGVTDRLREMRDIENIIPSHVRIFGVNNAASPFDKEHFQNLRAELAFNLKTQMENMEVDLDEDEDLQSQLSSIQYKMTSTGKYQLESKEDAKARGEPSPDRADAVILSRAPIQILSELGADSQVDVW